MEKIRDLLMIRPPSSDTGDGGAGGGGAGGGQQGGGQGSGQGVQGGGMFDNDPFFSGSKALGKLE